MEPLRAVTEEEELVWREKHGIKTNNEGVFEELPEGGIPVEKPKLLENVRINAVRHDIPNLHPVMYDTKVMVFVAGGPSANEFLEEIRSKSKHPHYDVFCSNATASWLLSKGIKPKYQVIIDPKPTKVDDVAHGDTDITYLLGLQCDPSVFEAVKGRKVFKFLAASATTEGESDQQIARAACTQEDPTILMIGGGTMMGTRAMNLADALGYHKLEYYGLDGSVKIDDRKVACYAYEKPRGEAIIEVECEDGRKFDSTMTFARQADEIKLFRRKMPWIDITIHGDGFLAHILKLDKAADIVQKPYRISPEYKAMQQQMAPSYVGVGRNHAPKVFLLLAQLVKVHGQIKMLDYGCGRRALEKSILQRFPDLGVTFEGYDPGIHGIDGEPEPADVVTCTDVMEHIEPECLDATLEHIKSLTRMVAYLVVDTQPAVKTLPDGRNAHILLQSPMWWRGQIKRFFHVIESSEHGSSVLFVCQPIQ